MAGADSIPSALLWTAVGCTLASCWISLWSILRHLHSYQRPVLQRLVIRIMLMIPIYSIASLCSLWSLKSAFFIDLVRDLYEAFVIYTFFSLLLLYLGGARSLLTLLHSSLRPPTPHPFPFNLVLHDLDLSDPHSYLALKRGVLQYCVIKPILAIVTVGLKLGEVYDEGQIGVGTGYTWVSVVYNASICLSLYCLAMFWVTIHSDVRPFRPTPKFLCVKGILFFSFWQSIGISLLVKWGAIKTVGSYTDEEHVSLALNNILISCEMPVFAIAHTYAFCVLSDYVDPALSYTARLPLTLAFKDAFGYLDLYYDFLSTLRGQGMSYRSFEPAGGEWGVVREGRGRERRLRDGLRYEAGGKGKYWLPNPKSEEEILKAASANRGYGATGTSSPTFGVIRNGHGPHSQGYRSPPPLPGTSYFPAPVSPDSDDSSVSSLDFKPYAETDAEELLYEEARGYLHGDWNYRVIDVSKETAKRQMREEEENVLRGWGRQGQGRRRGERWGRGEPIGRGGKGKDKDQQDKGAGRQKSKGGVYGGWQGEEAPYRESDNSQAEGSNPESPTVRPPTPPSSSSPRPPVSPSLTPDEPVREQWTTLKGKQVASGLKAVASKVVPPSNLRFSSGEIKGTLTPGSRSRAGSRPTSPGTGNGQLPPDAVDLVVEDEDAWERELERRRRKGEPGRHGEDVVDGIYKRAEFVVGEREKGRVVRERVNEEGVKVESQQPPLVHISPPASPSHPKPAPILAKKTFPSPTNGHAPASYSSQHRSPWFSSSANNEEEHSTTPVFSPPPADDDSNPWH